MNNFSNIEFFFNRYPKLGEIDPIIADLILFTRNPKGDRDYFSESMFLNTIRLDQDQYSLLFNGKKYLFSVFSDLPLQEFDKQILENQRYKLSNGLSRTLKFACSMDLINPRVAIGNSIVQRFNPIILYQTGAGANQTEMVIDYLHNLIMRKEDYYELFCFQEINVVNKLDLYHIYQLLEEFDFSTSMSIWELLLFSKEIFAEFSKKITFLDSNYDDKGINYFWYSVFGNYSDCLFFQKGDYTGTKYEILKEELDEFTKKPKLGCQHITYDFEKCRYFLKAEEFGSFEFNLLSDIVSTSDEEKILLSDSRKRNCHRNAKKIAFSLIKFKKDQPVYIVFGKVKCNEIDYFYHSWVEIEHTNSIIDYNHNLMMNRDKYYQLYEAVPISKIEASVMFDQINPLFKELDFALHPLILNCFGEEMMQDLKNNEKVLLKK